MDHNGLIKRIMRWMTRLQHDKLPSKHTTISFDTTIEEFNHFEALEHLRENALKVKKKIFITCTNITEES